MGVHISIYKVGTSGDRIRHPDWDHLRHAGDNELARMMSELPKKYLEGDDDDLFYPTDRVFWFAALGSCTWPNPGRWEQMMKIVTAPTEWAIRVSW